MRISSIAGAFPAPNWTLSGNSDVRIDNNFRASGNQSVRLYGSVGGCWAALLHRLLNVSPPFTIEFQTRNGSEPLSGCHPLRSVFQLHAGASWTTGNRSRRSAERLFRFRPSCSIRRNPSESVRNMKGTPDFGDYISADIRLNIWEETVQITVHQDGRF